LFLFEPEGFIGVYILVFAHGASLPKLPKVSICALSLLLWFPGSFLILTHDNEWTEWNHRGEFLND